MAKPSGRRSARSDRASSRPEAPMPLRRIRWYAALLVVAGALVYANSLAGPFIFDDRGTVLENRQIESLTDVGRVLAPPTETPVAGRPVVNATFAVNYAVGGRRVLGYHLGNIAMHLACALTLFVVVRRAFRSPRCDADFGAAAVPLAFAAALLWVVHPLATESVNYISQRTESTMALFYLLTLYAAMRVMSEDGRTSRWLAAAIGFAALGMASKESMVTAPVMVLLYDRLFVASSWRALFQARAKLYAGLAATWILLGALVATSPRTYSAGFTAHDADVVGYLLNQTVMVARYLRLAVWPTDLVLYYGFPLPLTLGDVWPQLVAIALLVALTSVALVRWPRAGFLGAWCFITLAPTSSIVPIATEVGAERRMYLPLMALLVLVVAGGTWLARRVRQPTPDLGPIRIPAAAVAVWLVAVIALGALTMLRNREYRSSLTLAETTLERWPTPAAHSMYGTELAASGRLDEAERHLRIAAPNFAPARYYLGTVLARRGEVDEATRELEAFIASQPPELEQVRMARVVLADAFMKTQQWDRAAEQYRQVLADRPGDLEAEALLANALVRLERFDEAIPLFQRVVAATPNDAISFSGLGIALVSSGRPDEAVVAFRRAASLEPSNSRSQQNLARALIAVGDVPSAREAAAGAVATAGSDPSAHELLGQILAMQGLLDEARREFEAALRIDPTSPVAVEGLRKIK